MWNSVLQFVNFMNLFGGFISSTITPALLGLILFKVSKIDKELHTIASISYSLQAMESSGNQEIATVGQLIRIMTAAATGKAIATNAFNANNQPTIPS